MALVNKIESVNVCSKIEKAGGHCSIPCERNVCECESIYRPCFPPGAAAVFSFKLSIDLKFVMRIFNFYLK